MLPPISVAILELLAEELTESEIGTCLEIEESSVRATIETLMSETNTHSLVSLLKEAIRRGWIK
ncbi:hypothetical protein [Dyadobacter bucti]|uniref:hypothetical protein n=1 Tax=Dyadobacter bucti TaxID=2572203 RepID=UPI001109AF34|nr:hypothetical protein [Dyadobacter bucti]